MSAQSRARYRERNIRRPCSVANCPKNRLQTSRYCHSHGKRKRLYASPTGRPLKATDLRSYRNDFSAFVARYRATPQVVTAIQFFDNLLSLGRPGGSPAESQLDRLQRHGVTGEEALHCVAAVWGLSRDRPSTLPDNDQLTLALGAELFKLRPQEGRMAFDRHGKETRHYFPPPAIARRHVGELVRSKLGTFFLRVEEAMNEDQRKARETAMTLGQPFLPA